MSETEYRVIAKRWRRGWELHIDGVGVTQSHRLTDAEDMVRDYIALDGKPDPGAVSIIIDVQVGDDLDDMIRQVREMTEQAERAQKEAAQRARQLVWALAERGLTGRETAQILKVSPQRVSQLRRPTTRPGKVKNGADTRAHT